MYNFIMGNLPWLWLGLFVLFVIIEAATQGLTTIWAAISAVIMIFLSKTKMPFIWQLLVFIVITLILIIFTRPFVMKKLKLGQNKTNVNTMEGQEVLVTKAITRFEKGEVKAKNGVIWSACSQTEEDIPVNAVCIITKVEGNTLTVKIKS